MEFHVSNNRFSFVTGLSDLSGSYNFYTKSFEFDTNCVGVVQDIEIVRSFFKSYFDSE